MKLNYGKFCSSLIHSIILLISQHFPELSAATSLKFQCNWKIKTQNSTLSTLSCFLATEKLQGKNWHGWGVLPDTHPICYHVTQNSQLNHLIINQWIIKENNAWLLQENSQSEHMNYCSHVKILDNHYVLNVLYQWIRSSQQINIIVFV